MTLIDNALQKAYGRSATKDMPGRRRGPHFTSTAPPTEDTQPNRELYVTEHQDAPECKSDEPGTADTAENVPDMPPVISFEQDAAETPVPVSGTEDIEPAINPSPPTRWLSLFRHEVSTDHPDLYGWHLPRVEMRTRGLPPFSHKTTEPATDAPPAWVPEFDAVELLPSTPAHQVVQRSDDGMPEANDVEAPADVEERVATDDSTSLATSEPVAEARTVVFRPSWEVDRFQLSEVCGRVEQALADRMQAACEQIIAECDQSRRAVTIGSWSRGEGRTTVSVVLARALARIGVTVVLVDGDCDNPGLAASLGLATEGGEFTGNVDSDSVAENCVYSVADKVTFLPFASMSVSESERWQSLDEAVDVLQRHYQIVIVDLPPGRSDACHRTVGLRVIVHSAAQTSEETLSRWVTRLENTVETPVKVIENFTSRQEAE